MNIGLLKFHCMESIPLFFSSRLKWNPLTVSDHPRLPREKYSPQVYKGSALSSSSTETQTHLIPLSLDPTPAHGSPVKPALRLEYLNTPSLSPPQHSLPFKKVTRNALLPRHPASTHAHLDLTSGPSPQTLPKKHLIQTRIKNYRMNHQQVTDLSSFLERTCIALSTEPAK